MKPYLTNKQILVGVTGGIAAYKSADLIRKLREAGASVRVVMTEKAKEFITPLTLQAVSGNPVHDDLFDLKAEAAMGHIELARWADFIIVAPATANFISRFAEGRADDLLTTVCLAARSKIALAPAMNQAMWKNPSTQENIQRLQKKGIFILGPGEGSQACGDVGPGRLLEPLELVESLQQFFSTTSLTGKKIVITAGPTREFIDPVRYISNASSGKMGYALASAAAEAGAKVILVSGPVDLPKPARIETIDVVSGQAMLDAVMNHLDGCDIFIGVAAVSDYRPKSVASQKIKKKQQSLELILEPTTDILAAVTASYPKLFSVGFAAETENVRDNAKLKLKNKKLDLIIANEISEKNPGFSSDENTVIAIFSDKEKSFSPMSKQKLARELIAIISEEFANKRR